MDHDELCCIYALTHIYTLLSKIWMGTDCKSISNHKVNEVRHSYFNWAPTYLVYACSSHYHSPSETVQMKIHIMCVVENPWGFNLKTWLIKNHPYAKYIFPLDSENECFFGKCCVISILSRPCLYCVLLHESYQHSHEGAGYCNDTPRSLLLSVVYFV